MLDRSIPLYREMQRMLGEIAVEFAVDRHQRLRSRMLERHHARNAWCGHRGAGKDASTWSASTIRRPMLDKARQRFAAQGAAAHAESCHGDLNDGMQDRERVGRRAQSDAAVHPAAVSATALIRAIHEGLNENGCLILVEKVLGNDSLFNRLFIKFYYDMKRRNDYSDIGDRAKARGARERADPVSPRRELRAAEAQRIRQRRHVLQVVQLRRARSASSTAR